MRRRALLASAGVVATGSVPGCLETLRGSAAARTPGPDRRPTPDRGLVVTGTADLDVGFATRVREIGGTYAVDAEDGDLAWELDGDVLAGAPVASEDAVYLPCEAPPETASARETWGLNPGRVLAVDPDAGDVLWRVTDDREGFRGLALGAGGLFARTHGNRLARVDPSDGERVWTTTDPADADPDRAGDPAPIVRDGDLAMTARHHCWGFDAETGDVAWSYDDLEGRVNDTAVDGSTLYLSGHEGTIHAVDIESGAASWTVDLYDALGIRARPRQIDVVGETLAGYASNGIVWTVDAATGTPGWADSFGPSPYHAFEVTETSIYAATSRRRRVGTAVESAAEVVAIDRDAGEPRWRFDEFGAQRTHGLVEVGGAVAVLAGSFVVLDAESGDVLHELSNSAGGFDRLTGDRSRGQTYVTTGDPSAVLGIRPEDGEISWESDALEHPSVVRPAVV